MHLLHQRAECVQNLETYGLELGHDLHVAQVVLEQFSNVKSKETRPFTEVADSIEHRDRLNHLGQHLFDQAESRSTQPP